MPTRRFGWIYVPPGTVHTPQTDQPCVFWWALVLTLIGAGFTLGGTAWLFLAAAGEKARRLQRREAGSHVIADINAKMRLLASGDTEGRDALDAEFAVRFREATGRSLTSYRDSMLIPEDTALAIIEEQIAELHGPAVLVVIGVVISTAGALVSLWLD